MAEAISFSIDGIKEVQSSLDKIEKGIRENLELNKELSKTLAQKASAMAPVLTGALASSIVGNPSLQKAQIVAGSAAVPYAGVQEYGWPQKNIKSQPYLRPAVNENLVYIIHKYEESIKDLVKQYDLN
jgi:phage gpG-like protein